METENLPEGRSTTSQVLLGGDLETISGKTGFR